MNNTHLSRFLARAVIAGVLGLVGMSLGCSQSPYAPTPSAGSVAPPEIADVNN